MMRLWQQYPVLKTELDLVQTLLEKQAETGEKPFDQIMTAWLGQRGKMLRPTLFLVASHFGEPMETAYTEDGSSGSAMEEKPLKSRRHRLCENAAAIELIHMATLVHDDVIDEATLRRGRPTVHSTMGKDYAVYMGDYMFCKALVMVADHDVSRAQLKRLANGMTQVCLGEIRQYHARYLIESDLRRYYKIIASKTAALFSLSLYTGAIEGGCDEVLATRLGKIGYNLGMAFQVVDDLLDYSQEEQVGKTPYQDLIQGNYNLPVRLALKGDFKESMTALLEGLESGKSSVLDLVALVRASGAHQASNLVAEKYTRRAMKYVERLPEHPSKDILKAWIPELIKRKG